MTRAQVSCRLGWPFTEMDPFKMPWVLRPASTSINVVLPAPVPPMRAVSTPGRAYPAQHNLLISWKCLPGHGYSTYRYAVCG